MSKSPHNPSPARRWQNLSPARRWQSSSPARRWHDMGGEAAGPVPHDQHDFALWEKRVDALMILGSGRGHFTVDGLRRALEEMGPQAFEEMSYYERWVAAINENLVEAGVYSIEELGAKMEEVQARGDTYGEAQNA
jgi:hypothetical protein